EAYAVPARDLTATWPTPSRLPNPTSRTTGISRDGHRIHDHAFTHTAGASRWMTGSFPAACRSQRTSGWGGARASARRPAVTRHHLEQPTLVSSAGTSVERCPHCCALVSDDPWQAGGPGWCAT